MGRIISVVASAIMVFCLLVHPLSAQQRNMTIGMTNWAENIAVANLWNSHGAIYQALLPGSRFERRPPLPYHPDEENHHDDQQGRRPQGRHSPDRRTRS